MDEFIPKRMQFNVSERFSEIGFCIYCGDRNSRLSDEHIVPFGLGGNSLILPLSSCKRCAEITSKFELDCLRSAYGLFRGKIGAPTRRPKKRNPHLRISIGKRGVTGLFEPNGVHIDSSLSDLPLFYITPLMEPPGILLGKQPCSTWTGKFWTLISEGADLSRIQENKEGLHLCSINPLSFSRMLAKIGYAYAIAKLGTLAFRPLILDLILGRSEMMTHWIGGQSNVPPPTPADEIHQIRSAWATLHNTTYLIVTIRLFSSIGSPEYIVVVGTREK